MKKKKEYLEGILTFANELIFMLDAQGNFTFINPKIKDWGYEEDELIGRHLISLLFNKQQMQVNQILHAGSSRRVKVEAVDKQNNVRNVLLSTSRIKNKEGQLIGILGVASDITELRSLEHKLVQSDRLASIGQLVAGIAHELNNPIGVIYLYSTESLRLFERITNTFKESNTLSIIEDTQRLIKVLSAIDCGSFVNKELFEQELSSIIENLKNNSRRFEETYNVISKNRFHLHEYLEGSAKESIRCKELIGGLLDFSRQKEPRMSWSNVNKLIDNILNIVEKQYRKEKIDVVRNFDPRIPDTMMDSSQVEQVIINIANNAVFAIKESLKEALREDVRKKGILTIGTHFHADKESIEICIKDNGMGINKHDLGKIFDPFFTARKDGKGTGLGLSISYGIVKMHDGSIEAESMAGKGTTFRIFLPVKGKKPK